MIIDRDPIGRNPVVSKMWELASIEKYGMNDRLIIRQARVKELVRDKKYQWSLYEQDIDTAPVEVVTLDVTSAEARQIIEEVASDLRILQRSESRNPKG